MTTAKRYSLVLNLTKSELDVLKKAVSEYNTPEQKWVDIRHYTLDHINETLKQK